MKSSAIWQRTSALSLLLTVTLLTGCAKQQNPQVEYRTIKNPQVSLPAELTSPIDVPSVPESLTFGESVELNAELYGALGQCNIDRAAIKELEKSRL